jgi:hypothetical protein
MLLHILTNPLMLYFWLLYALILGALWYKWFGLLAKLITVEVQHRLYPQFVQEWGTALRGAEYLVGSVLYREARLVQCVRMPCNF